MWYHADYLKPSWRKAFERGPQIGRHIFYSQAPRKTLVASRIGTLELYTLRPNILRLPLRRFKLPQQYGSTGTAWAVFD